MATAKEIRNGLMHAARKSLIEEPADVEKRLRCFVARSSGWMEGLGESDLEQALWSLLQLNHSTAAVPSQPGATA